MRATWIVPALLPLLIASCANNGGAEGEDANSPPYQPVPNDQPGEIRGEVNLAKLLASSSRGVVKNMPWSGSWWPYSQNGISAAARQYEALTGNAGATSWEVSHHGTGLPGIQDWWGHCNGWAAAAVLFQEPKAPVTVNGVSLGVADQKALLSEVGMEVSATYFGHRNDSDNPESESFEDVYPNQFLVALANVVGAGSPMIMDRYTGSQVWNHPIAGYIIAPVTQGNYLGTGNLGEAGTVHRVMMSLEIWWLRDDVSGDQTTEPFEFKDGPSYESRTLRFEAWLDAPPVFGDDGQLESSGNVKLFHDGKYVKGGQWRNGDYEAANSHPDYFWIPYDVTPSSGFSNPGIDPNVLLKSFAVRS